VNDLKDFDPAHDYAAGLPKFDTDGLFPVDEEHVVQEKLRRKALKVDALMYKDDAYWANFINSRSEERRLHNEFRAKRPPCIFEDAKQDMIARRKKLKDRSTSRASAGPLMTPESMPRQNANVSSAKVMKSVETIADTDDESVFIRDSRQLSDPSGSNPHDEDEDGEEAEYDARLERIRRKNVQRIKDNVPP
jgi:hypothetical protein